MKKSDFEAPIDQGFSSINTPVQAEKHYLPLLLSKEYDLMAIKKELIAVHRFSDADALISVRVLSSAQLQHVQRNPSKGNGYVILDYLHLILGIVLFGGGLIAILFLWDLGWVSTIPFVVMGAGITTIFRTNILGEKG